MELSSSCIKNFLIFFDISGNRNPQKFFIFQERGTLKSFLYFRNCDFLRPNSKKAIKFLIFWEMELSDTKIKNFLVFPEMKLCTFQSKRVNFLYSSGNRSSDEISYVFSKESFSYILGNRSPNKRNFFKFQETESLKNFFYFRK